MKKKMTMKAIQTVKMMMMTKAVQTAAPEVMRMQPRKQTRTISQMTTSHLEDGLKIQGGDVKDQDAVPATLREAHPSASRPAISRLISLI